jgi:serine/threonine protein kinase
MMKTLCGTPMYVAPEVMAMSMGIREPTFEPSSGYGKSVDMWSLGVILYMLLCGRPPWPDLNFSNLCETVLKGVFEFPPHLWKDVSSAAKQLVSALLTVSPSKRITVDEAIQHPWMTGEPLSPEVLPPSRKENDSDPFVAPSNDGTKKRRYDSPRREGTATTASSSEELLFEGDEREEDPFDNNNDENYTGLMRLINARANERLTPHLAREFSSPSRVIPSAEATPILPPSNPNGATRLAFVDSPSSGPTVRKLGFETPEKRATIRKK